MPTINFYFDKRRNQKENAILPLKLSVTHKRKTAYLSLDVRLRQDQWDPDREKIVKHPEASSLNRFIIGRKYTAETAVLRMEEEAGLADLTAADIRDAILLKFHPELKEKMAGSAKNLFLPRFNKFIEPKKESTKECYMHTLNRITAFIGEKKLSKLTFEDITLDWLNEFNAFMKTTSKSQNARNVHFRNIRAAFNNAIENDITTHYPFHKFKIKAVETAKRSLSVEELRRVFFFPCEEHQEKYRDIFKLSFFLMGVNIIDLANLTEVINGRLRFNREKTGHLYSMKVEPEAQELISRYKGTKHLLFILDRWVNDEFFRRKMNKELQKLGPVSKKSGRGGKKVYEPLFPNITSYWARHSWATIACDLDVPDRVIAEGLGHTFGNPVTNIYIRFNEKKVDAANRKVLDWVLYGKIDGKTVVKPGTPEFYGLDKEEAVRLGLCKQSELRLEAFRMAVPSRAINK